MNEPTSKKAAQLVKQIEHRYNKLKWKRWISRLLLPFSVFIFGIALFIWLEQQVYFSSTTKTVVGLGLLVLGVGVMWWRKRDRSLSLSEFYASISDGIQQPALKHALDLSLKSRDSHLKLYEYALQKNIESFSWDATKQKIDRQIKDLPDIRFFRHTLGAVGLSLVVLLVSSLVHPDASLRTARFWNDFQKPNPYTFSVAPGNTTIEQGGTFQPSITFDGSVPNELLLGIKTDVEKSFRFRPLQETSESTFTAEAIQLSSNASYYIRMDNFSSEQYGVNVQLRPRFESLSVEVFPPAYTRLDSTKFTYPFSQVKAYQGSEIKVIGHSNKPLHELHMISAASDDTTQPDNSGSRSFVFSRSVSSADTLRFTMNDSSGLSNSNDFSFIIDAVQDEYPFVELLDPTENVKMSSPTPLDISYRTSDDFGVTSAVLHYELQRAFTQQPETGTVNIGVPQLNLEQIFQWDVPSLNPKPRDVVTFWLEVTDNDEYNGHKQSQSRKLTITLPSLVENIEAIDQQESEVQKNLEDVSQSFEEMQKEYDRFKQDLQQNPETNYQQKQMLEQVQEKQEEIDKKVKELNQKFEEIRKEMSKNDLVSEETRQAYEELQNLMKEIDDPELQKALEELQKSLGNLNQQQLRKTLENYEFNEEVYKERLNRTIELFKSLKMNSDLEKMAKALEDLANKEEELSKSEASPSEQAEQQEAIQNDTEKVSEQMEKLNENAPEKSKQKINDLQQQSQKEIDSVQQQLQENIEQLRKQQQEQNQQGSPNSQQQQQQRQQRQQNQQQQQQIQQQFQQLSQKMREAKQQFNQQRMQVNMEALQNILHNLVNLSEEQEDLTQSTENLANRSQAFVEKARTQQNISRQFAQVSDSLFAVSSQIPGFSNQINVKKKEVEQNLQRSVDQLAERNKSQSTYAERQAFGGINELSSMVASLMDQLQNQQQNGMGGGMSMQQFMQQLQNMSGSQQQLNQQIQNLINDIQGDRLSRDQIDRLNQLARQQNQIRKQLQKLQQSGELEAGDKLLSELERMADEMEKTINDLRGGQTDGELVKRQENILSRMLNAEKAMQERGEKDEREGTTSEDPPRSVPADMTLEELQKKMRNLLNDPNQTNFSEDYQRLIEQYFELLKQLNEDGVSS
ncbi:hypothetical protein NC796_20395 [Aliifodinibius sp. S!AR15-10]|uniref:DUF4175 family protein n=1 Tax=Aliifodinibius sp. S!AR15-10 TaxID=2950437 RepID=UPI002861407D|nr:DUF4175 family protein [Aliifodinibius sp. S!AR15-10]MDR8393526.1 hypothetical protein [Aliifodinibius sp. S!AR15-10]